MNITRRKMLQTSSAMVALGASMTWLSSNESTQLVENAQAQNLSDVMKEGALPDLFMGKEDAPVTIIEYNSMTCPHCAHFHTEVLPAIKKNYIDTGKVKLIQREFPLDARAYAASMLARCSGKDTYFPMTDVLFKKQSVWARAEDPRPELLKIAKLAGFTQESFETCLKNQELLDKVNQTRTKAAEVYGITGVPSFFIDGEKYSGRVSIKDLSKAIDSRL